MKPAIEVLLDRLEEGAAPVVVYTDHLTVDDPRHGTTNGYTNLGCRCQPCRDAFAAYHRDYIDRHPEQRMKHNEREARRYREAVGMLDEARE